MTLIGFGPVITERALSPLSLAILNLLLVFSPDRIAIFLPGHKIIIGYTFLLVSRTTSHGELPNPVTEINFKIHIMKGGQAMLVNVIRLNFIMDFKGRG